MKNLTYQQAGVDYNVMDPFKRACVAAGLETARHLPRFGFSEVGWTRGESVYVVKTPQGYIGLTVEGLGTKNLVAEAFRQQLWDIGESQRISGPYFNRTYYGNVGICNCAMIFNDMITLGIRPVAVGMHLSVGESGWFSDRGRWQQYIAGTKEACNQARCAWGCGETPTLKGIIAPGASELSGAAWGFAEKLIECDIRDGDAIVIFASSGIHANWLTGARKIAEQRDGFWRRLGHLLFPKRVESQELPDGYLTRLSDGRYFGEALLDPTFIYVPIIEDLLDAGAEIHYCVNVTGHGWRKLMRAPEPFVYCIERLPRGLPVFDFIQRHGPVDDREAYANLNMGAGFAVYVPPDHVSAVIAAAAKYGIEAFNAGVIRKHGTRKTVRIIPKCLEYDAETLGVR